jgi:hypothetical protein
LSTSAFANHSVLVRVSVGQINGNANNTCGSPATSPCSASWAGSSSDGSRVFFDTTEQLVSADTDTNVDLYERSNGTTTLVSTGSTATCPISGGCDAFFAGASQDGTKVFFHTKERLVAGDTDSKFDIYQRSAATTTQVSVGAINGNGAFDAFLTGTSVDGSRVFFESNEPLASADTDTQVDVYERSGGTTTSLVSTGPTSAVGSFFAHYKGASEDGTKVFFETDDRLVSSDTDSQADVYQRSAATTTLLSTGPTGGNGALPAGYDGASADGSHVFFHSEEQLVAADTDGQRDIYDRTGGTTTTLVSAGQINGNGPNPVTFDRASSDGSHVFFETFEQLASADTDASQDVYDRSGGTTTTLVSAGQINGNLAFDVFFDGSSANGAHVFFETNEPLASGDTDSSFDIYDRSSATTTLMTRTPTAGNGTPDAFYDGNSSDGSRLFFDTTEQLLATDTDSQNDVYEHSSNGLTTRLSRGPAGGNGNTNCGVSGTSACPASYAGSTPDGAFVYLHTIEKLSSDDLDKVQDAYSITPFDAPQDATPLTVALVPNFRQTISTTQCTNRGGAISAHGTPDIPGGSNPDDSCNPPAFVPNTVAHFGNQAVASASLTAVLGDFSTTADDADLAVTVNATDVRGGSATGADYNPVAAGPDLTLQLKLRTSDTLNGSPLDQPATVSDRTLQVPVSCATTPSPTIGSTCSAISSADGILAGSILEGQSTVLQAFRVRLTDAGVDGIRNPTTGSDDKDFAQQGYYVP